MFRTPIPPRGEPLREGLEQLPPFVARPGSVRGSGRTSTDPLAYSTTKPTEAGRASSISSRASSKLRNDTLHELVKRAREAKRELAAIEREIADVVVETTPSIVDTERAVAQLLHDTDYRDEPNDRELGSHIPAAVTGRQPGNHIPATVTGPIRSENYRLSPQVVAVPAKHPVRQSTAIDEELRKIEKQFEQRLLEEELLAIERSELRRLAETKQLLEESCRPSKSYTARQPEESYRPAVNFVPVRPERTTQAP